MEFLGHSVHQMLIVFPLGLLATSVVFDLIALAARTGAASTAAYWAMAAGLIGALLAAPFGFLDWLKVPHRTRARRIGAWHGGGNLLVVVLFAAAWWLRQADGSASAATLTLELCGVAISLVTAWLGGELVTQLGIGVHEDAGADAPSSLRDAHGRLR
jgi:uncharacterized membrane protein